MVLYDRTLTEIAHRKTETAHIDGPPYRHLAPAGILAFIVKALRELDAVRPVDVITVSAFGATLACLDEAGQLAFPVMDYLAEPPAEIVAGYDRIAPPFSEVFSLTAPWHSPSPNSSIGLKPYGRTSSAGSAPSCPGASTSPIAWAAGPPPKSPLWACSPIFSMCATRVISSLAQAHGWDRLFAPLAKAWEVIGQLGEEQRGDSFRGAGRILSGIHDSNANYLRYLASGGEHFTLLSTGTFIIGFDTATDLGLLDPARDSFSFTDVFGRPVGCCRFFGGREFETLLNGVAPGVATADGVQSLIDAGVFALPAFSDTGGPVAGRGNKGSIVGPFADETSGARLAGDALCGLDVSRASRCLAIGQRHHY